MSARYIPGAVVALTALAALAQAAQPGPTTPPSAAANSTVGASAGIDGASLFVARCGYCHLAGGTGTLMLARRHGKDHALLAERTDLDRDYVRAVVRNGLNSMPALTRVEVPDEQLDAIATYLSGPKGKAR